MKKMWRPDRWVNQYGDDRVEDVDLSRFVAIMKDGSCIDETTRKALRDKFEAGADAILKAIAIKLQAIYNIADLGTSDRKMGEFIQKLMEEVSE